MWAPGYVALVLLTHAVNVWALRRGDDDRDTARPGADAQLLADHPDDARRPRPVRPTGLVAGFAFRGAPPPAALARPVVAVAAAPPVATVRIPSHQFLGTGPRIASNPVAFPGWPPSSRSCFPRTPSTAGRSASSPARRWWRRPSTDAAPPDSRCPGRRSDARRQGSAHPTRVGRKAKRTSCSPAGTGTPRKSTLARTMGTGASSTVAVQPG